MSAVVAEPTEIRNIAQLLRHLGDIAPERIRFRPYPGTATVADVVANKGCELVDGVLVEKVMGTPESTLAAYLIHVLQAFVLPRNLGMVTGEQGTWEIMPDLVRIPDVAYTSFERLPGRRVPREPVPALALDLVAEVISTGNRPAEMTRKRNEYLDAGVRLVWMIDPARRTVTVYSATTQPITLTDTDTLDGGDVLRGLTVPVQDLFYQLDRHG